MATRYAVPPDQGTRVATGAGGGPAAQAAERIARAEAPIGSSLESLEIALRPSRPGWRATIRYRRPDLQDLVSGRPAPIARDRLGLVHSVCGYAHELAFTRAVEAIDGTARATLSRRAARDLRLTIETAVAHASRAALELAPACDRDPGVAELRAILDAAAAADRALGMEGLDASIAPDQSRLSGAFRQLFESLGAVLRSVPPAPPNALLGRLPTAVQSTVTAGWRRPWSFMTGFTYRTARLLRQLGAEPALQTCSIADSRGLGSATTSRGRLIYEVTTNAGRVLTCRTSTPTERLTAPDGPLASVLSRLPDDDDVEALARLAVLAADPCAPASISLATRSRVLRFGHRPG